MLTSPQGRTPDWHVTACVTRWLYWATSRPRAAHMCWMCSTALLGWMGSSTSLPRSALLHQQVHIPTTSCHMTACLCPTVLLSPTSFLSPACQVVEQDLPGTCQAAVLRLIQRATSSSPGLAREFAALKGTLMLAHCLRSTRTPASQDVAEVMAAIGCGGGCGSGCGGGYVGGCGYCFM